MVKTAFRADQLALAPFEQDATVDAILPVMKFVLLEKLFLLDL